MLGTLSRPWLVAAATVATLVALPATAHADPLPSPVSGTHTVSGPPTCDGVQITAQTQQVGVPGTPQVYLGINIEAPAECRAGTRIIYSSYNWDMVAGEVRSAQWPKYEVIDAGGETIEDQATSGLWWDKPEADLMWLDRAVVLEVVVRDGDVCSLSGR